MSETASVNPNESVGAEEGLAAKAIDAVTFDDIEQSVGTNKPKAKAKQDKPQGETKARPGKGKQVGLKIEEAEAGEEEDEGPDTERTSGADTKPDSDKARPKAETQKSPGKSRVLKARVGDKDLDIPGDAVFTAKIDGVEETTASLEDLINNYSGRSSLDRRAAVFRKEREQFETSRSKLNSHVEELFKVSQESPESAIDYLAEIAGKDPVEIKMAALKANIDQLRDFFALSEREQAQWLKEKELGFRDAKFKRLEDRTKAGQEASKAIETAKTEALRYGIADDEYVETARVASEHLRREASPAEVIRAQRAMLVHSQIEELLPEIAAGAETGSKEYGEMFDALLAECMRNPAYGKAGIAADIRAAFGSKRTKAISRRESLHSQTSRPVTSSVKPQHEDILSFDQL